MAGYGVCFGEFLKQGECLGAHVGEFAHWPGLRQVISCISVVFFACWFHAFADFDLVVCKLFVFPGV